MKKKSRNILLIILGIIVLIGLIVGIFYAIGIFQQTFPNQINYIGLRPDFPFDGNNINIHLTYSSAPDNWNLGWNDFTISWADAVTTSINGRTCTELGLYRDHAGEWSGGCGLNPILNDNNVISKTATLDGQPIKNINLGRDGVTVSGWSNAVAGNLVIDIKVELKCVIGTEKCSGTHNLVCESVNQHFGAWYSDTGWDSIVNRYIDKGEILNKCGFIKNIEVFRFENNKCTKLTIDESKKLTNDYLIQSECESKIVIIDESGYNLINNKCEKVSSNAQYKTLSECESNLLCMENWNCNEFSNCINSQQSRTCTDLNNCGTITSKPSLTQQCNIIPPVIPCVESWTYSEWSNCLNGQSTRTAIDSNSCGTTINKEELSKNCQIEQPNFWNQKTLGIKNIYWIIGLISLVIVFILIFFILIKYYGR